MNFLQQEFLSNTIESYIICAITIFIILIFKRLFSKYIASILFRLIKNTSWKVSRESFFDLLVQPLEIFLVLLVSFVTLDKLTFPAAFHFTIHKTSAEEIVDSIGSCIIIIAFIGMLLRFIDFVATTMQDNQAQFSHHVAETKMVSFFKDFFKAIIVLIGIILVIRFAFHKDVTKLLAGLSIVGAAIALAAKESLENLIASFIIFFDKPFHIGDSVKVLNISGSVEKIGLRSTRIRTDQKTFVTVPNKQMVDSVLDNLTLRSLRRADIRLEISLSTSADTMQKIADGIKKILTHPVVTNSNVTFSDITQNAYILTVEYYTGVIPQDDFNQLKQTINLQVLRLLEDNKVELAGKDTRIIIGKEG